MYSENQRAPLIPVHCIIALKKNNHFSFENGGLVSLRSEIETVSAELWLQIEPRVWFLASLFSQLIVVKKHRREETQTEGPSG